MCDGDGRRSWSDLTWKTYRPASREGAQMPEQEIGVVTHYFDKISVGAIRLTDAPLSVGDMIHIQGHSTDFEQTVASIQIEHEAVHEAKPGDEIGIKVSERVHEHDKVFKVE
jgi:translation elongation factor EF-1alpha